MRNSFAKSKNNGDSVDKELTLKIDINRAHTAAYGKGRTGLSMVSD